LSQRLLEAREPKEPVLLLDPEQRARGVQRADQVLDGALLPHGGGPTFGAPARRSLRSAPAPARVGGGGGGAALAPAPARAVGKGGGAALTGALGGPVRRRHELVLALVRLAADAVVAGVDAAVEVAGVAHACDDGLDRARVARLRGADEVVVAQAEPFPRGREQRGDGVHPLLRIQAVR